MRYLTPTTIFLALILTLVSATVKSNPEGYTYIADENQSKTFDYPVDLAFGADGKYYYLDGFVGTIRFDNAAFGGDPIKGKTKAGYVKNHSTTSSNKQPINEYRLVANENETMTFDKPVDLAYGANDRYHHIDNFVGTITFDNKTFGGDPIKGSSKAGYMKSHRYTTNNNQNNNQGISDYQFAANENETQTFLHPVDLAYGANGKYHYINDFVGTVRFDNKTFGGDPNKGATKSGYVKYQNNPQQHNDINDYEMVAKEGETKTFKDPVNLAYGANGKYHYINDFVGTVRFDNKTFGGDPIDKVAKFGYVKQLTNSNQVTQNINDYEMVAKEGNTMTFKNPVDLAYGANGKFHFINNFTGTIKFDNKAFGGDPIDGVAKLGYVRYLSNNNQTNLATQNIEDYKRIAVENETRTFDQPVDLAYGAKGKYNFINNFTGTIRFDNETFGSERIMGAPMAGYMKPSQSSQPNSQNIDDYKFAGNENDSKTFNRPVDLAYGANGKYHFINNFTGTIRFDNKSFGGDPSPGNKKQGFVRKINLRKKQ